VMDVSAVAASGAIKVNLWHGVPLKMIERDITQPDHPLAQANHGSLLQRAVNKLLRPQLSERYDYVLGTSRATCERLAGAFGIPASRVIMGGYPRTDVLLRPVEEERYRMPEEEQIIEICRAHRDEGRRVQRLLVVTAPFVLLLALVVGSRSSLTNAISGIILVGAMLAAGPATFDWGGWVGVLAVALASVNVFGGFLVTQRMLEMFRKKEPKAPAAEKK